MTRVTTFLDDAGWARAGIEAIPSDASDRSYRRVRRDDGATAILMRAPVQTSDLAARQFAAFRRVSEWLRGLGFAAPAEYAADPQEGFLLIEDLGDIALSRLLDHGSPDAARAYETAVSVLARLSRAPAPPWMNVVDAAGMAAMVGLTFDLLPGSEALAEETRGFLSEHLAMFAGASGVSLRDVHGDNLIWRADREGLNRIGLIDFQDAVVLPDGYDLASLLDDPRRIVPGDWRDDLIRAYAAALGHPYAELSRRVSLLSLQRNLRILGIFRRLATERGRPDYARYLPRTRSLLMRAASHPDLRRFGPPIAELLDRTEHWQAEAA